MSVGRKLITLYKCTEKVNQKSNNNKLHFEHIIYVSKNDNNPNTMM